MTLLESQIAAWLADFFWPLIRIAAIFTAAPILSTKQVSAPVRVSLAILVTLVAMPLLPPMPVVNALSPEAFLLVLEQLAIGFMMGFILQMVFGALVYGGQALAYSMGLGFASMVDPVNGSSTPVVAQIFVLLATLLFLVTNSHLVLLDLVVQSFHTLPVGGGIDPKHYWNLAAWGSRMFAGGLLIALPVVATLLMVNMGMGVVARAAPQFNLFAVGFPMTITLGLVIIWVSLPSILTAYVDLLSEAFDLIRSVLGIKP